MPLISGTKLGPYEIVASLGAGGMGEVYRARDTRLERTVAIKILPAHFSADPVSKQRFEREAKTISSLNHPNICVLRVHARTSFSALTGFAPVWSPDGLQLAYSHSAPGISGDHIYLLNADGTGREQLLEKPFLESIANYPSSWSPDGTSLLFDRQDKSGKISVWVLPLTGDQKPYVFVETQFDSQIAMFSPDGRWVAYVSNDSGKAEVYVVPFPGPGPRVQVSTGGGSQPRWRRDGRELFYLSLATEMMAADVSAVPGDFRVGAVRTLFALRGLGGVPGNLYRLRVGL
jgi:hypothetical protein